MAKLGLPVLNSSCTKFQVPQYMVALHGLVWLCNYTDIATIDKCQCL